MSFILLDTNIWIDLFGVDTIWHKWSAEIVSKKIPLLPAYNDIIFAELAAGMDADALNLNLIAFDAYHLPMTRAALVQAGFAYRRYRHQGGRKTSLLPDFFIGALAASENIPLLTRDAARYRTYFPDCQLITPETNYEF